MKRTMSKVATVLLAIGSFCCSAEGQDLPAVDGVYGMTSVGTGAWLAVRLDVPNGVALAGLRWFNNDERATITSVMVGTGLTDGPGQLVDFLSVASNVAGGSSSWSTATFDIPVAASLGSLYVVFELPMEAPLNFRGLGGGAGVGFGSSADGLRGWLTGDGDIWAELDPEFGFAVFPIFTPYVDGMAIKSLNGAGLQERKEVIRPYLQACPNPFNPETIITFGLAQDAWVTIDVYDLRGCRVERLVCSEFAAGKHEVTWSGKDSSGRSVASGVYVAKLRAGTLSLAQRLIVIR